MKVKLFIVLLLVMFCTGCNGSVTRTIRKSGYMISGNKFTCATLTATKTGFFSSGEKKEKIKSTKSCVQKFTSTKSPSKEYEIP